MFHQMPDLPRPLLELVRRVRDVALPALVAAHRGDSQNAPENTLAAVALAIDHGATLVEFDVRETADGEVVVIHDEKVDRTCDGHGEVARLRTAELREMSAGGWFAPHYQHERVPLLDEVLDLCRGRAIPLIEVKSKRRRHPHTGDKIAAALQRHGLAERAVVICREVARVREVQAASPATPVAYLTYTPRQARGVRRLEGVGGVDCYWKSLSLGLVDELRRASLFLTPWTVNRLRDMHRLLLLGVETIITDCPVTLADAIEAFELEQAHDLRRRIRAGELDLELAADLAAGDEPSDELPRELEGDSELDIDVDWPEDPDAAEES